VDDPVGDEGLDGKVVAQQVVAVADPGFGPWVVLAKKNLERNPV
jgi:hypothetical protein